MDVFHVTQIVSPNHNTSYKPGRNWIESHDSEADANRRAEIFNYFRSIQCVGVEYAVIGPVAEDRIP